MSESVICPYCQQQTEYVSSSVVYRGRDYGMIYLCRKCDAWVGCHKGTTSPLGRVADAELREAKKAAHAAFDPIWRAKMTNQYSKFRARNEAYAWLAQALGIPREDCHIGMMDVELCLRTIAACKGKTS